MDVSAEWLGWLGLAGTIIVFIPAFRSLRRDLRGTLRAKRAVTEAVLARAQRDEAIRRFVLLGDEDRAQTTSAAELVSAAAENLDPAARETVRRSIKLGEAEGNTRYAGSVIRQVRAELAQAG